MKKRTPSSEKGATVKTKTTNPVVARKPRRVPVTVSTIERHTAYMGMVPLSTVPLDRPSKNGRKVSARSKSSRRLVREQARAQRRNFAPRFGDATTHNFVSVECEACDRSNQYAIPFGLQYVELYLIWFFCI